MFQTRVEIPPSEFKISYQHSLLALGSCFAENIGRKLSKLYFETELNPFGVLYNPTSIANSILTLLNNRSFTSNDIFLQDGLWKSFAHSSLFSARKAEDCLALINDRLENAIIFLQRADYLLITFGTAWVFEEKETGRIVSNCHKLPARNFIRRRLTVLDIVTQYATLLKELSQRFPKLKVLFSVSPIRHFKDGAHENNLSKSTLLLAIEQLQVLFPQQVLYFPAYEIQLDELRDYRFYASDMAHPSDVAVDYIWERFSETYFSAGTMQTKAEFEQLYADLNHRPLHTDSPEFLQFQQALEKRKLKLLENYPFLSNRVNFN